MPSRTLTLAGLGVFLCFCVDAAVLVITRDGKSHWSESVERTKTKVTFTAQASGNVVELPAEDVAFVLQTVEKNFETYDFDKAYKAMYDFCNEDLSSIYLDILKDRLYTSPAKSTARCAAQTVLYDILDVLVRLLSPILVFTTEEIFAAMPRTKELEGVKSVHLLEWPKAKSQWSSERIEKKLDTSLRIRPEVLKSLEVSRQRGEIGSSLDAKIVFETASVRDYKGLIECLDDLRYIYIVSEAEVKKVKDIDQGEGANEQFTQTRIIIQKADGQKCPRCWNYSVRIGEDKEHSTLCERCTSVVKEKNDAR